jgi:hypothetical protein
MTDFAAGLLSPSMWVSPRHEPGRPGARRGAAPATIASCSVSAVVGRRRSSLCVEDCADAKRNKDKMAAITGRSNHGHVLRRRGPPPPRVPRRPQVRRRRPRRPSPTSSAGPSACSAPPDGRTSTRPTRPCSWRARSTLSRPGQTPPWRSSVAAACLRTWAGTTTCRTTSWAAAGGARPR